MLLPSPFSFCFVDPQFLVISESLSKSFDIPMLAETQLELLLAMLRITKPIMLAEILSFHLHGVQHMNAKPQLKSYSQRALGQAMSPSHCKVS